MRRIAGGMGGADHDAGVVTNSGPLPDYYPPSIGRFRVRCGGGVRARGGVRIKQSDSDFNERGNNLAGGQKWAQHRLNIMMSISHQ